jgi:hypothetical protein
VWHTGVEQKSVAHGTRRISGRLRGKGLVAWEREVWACMTWHGDMGLAMSQAEYNAIHT